MQLNRRDIKSYVLREGRITPGQKRALKEHWSEFGLDIEDGLLDSPFPKTQEMVLEIGFGMGDSLFEMASLYADQNFIGVEVHRPGVGHLLQLAAEMELKNLRVFRADSKDVLNQCVLDHSLDKVQIFFPDPWHKKKHNKRRLINNDFVDLLAEKLKHGGVLHIATDWAPYAEVILEVMQNWTTCKIPDRAETKYERRGLRLDHEVFDFAFENSSKRDS